MARTGLVGFLMFLTTFFMASILGIFRALSIAASTIELLYFLDSNKSFSSDNLLSLDSGSEQIQIIL